MHENRRTRLVLAVLLVAAIALITVSYRDGGTSGATGAGNVIFGPAERVAGDVTRPIAGFFHAATNDDASEIASLQTQNDQLRAQLSHLQISQQDDVQLKRLLQLNAKGGYQIVTASVIAAGGDYSDTVTIDVGSAAGVQPNETVLNGDGLIGVVTSVGATSSTVQLATDASSSIGVRLAGSNTIGAVAGSGQTMAGNDTLHLTLFSATAVLTRGDQLVTFGSVGGRPYVPGVPVGYVQAVTSDPGSLTQTALITPYADFTGIGVVGVVVAPPHANPGDTLLTGFPGHPANQPARPPAKAGSGKQPAKKAP
ncbi:MAG TPA: rod shape-determining protein MreC [Trebonia sp.]